MCVVEITNSFSDAERLSVAGRTLLFQVFKMCIADDPRYFPASVFILPEVNKFSFAA